MKKPNGITLIALVITIIVLLILAGVSISAVIGENGIATKAKEAAERTEEAKKEEEEFLDDVEDYLNGNIPDVNEYGFYFNQLYVATVLQDGNENKTGVIFHEDGSFEEFYIFDDLNEVYNGNLILNNFSPKDTIDYENWNGITITNNGKTLINPDGVNFECSFGKTHGIYVGEEYKTNTVLTDPNNVTYEYNMILICNEDGSIVMRSEPIVDGEVNEDGIVERTMATGEYEANGYSLRFGEEIDAAVYSSPNGNAIMMDGFIFVKK